MVEIVSLKKSYGTKVVLNIDNFTFENGKKYALVGTNGCGKSTLLKIFDKVESFDAGEIFMDENTTISYMPQNSYAFKMSLKANISIAIPSKSISQKTYKDYKSRVEELITSLGLDSLKKKNASKLSGGETQRMALARTLLQKCDLLLMDEPTSAMDIPATKVAEEVIIKYCEEYNPTVIFATHSLNQAERLADVVLFMKEGEIIEVCDAKTFINEPKTEELKEFLNKA